MCCSIDHSYIYMCMAAADFAKAVYYWLHLLCLSIHVVVDPTNVNAVALNDTHTH